MNPNQVRVVLRPRGVLEVFDLAWRLMRERWGVGWRLALWVLGPVWVLLVGACWLFDGHVALVAVPLLLGPVLRAPFTVAGGRLLFAERVSQWEILVHTLRGTPTLAAHIAAYFLANTLTCGLMLPAVQSLLLYQPETALLERVGPQRGIRRSLRLASAHFGIALAGAAGTWVLVVWFALLGEFAGQSVVGFVLQLGQPFGALNVDHVTPWFLGGILAAQPVIALYRLLLYVDVRTRIEGWDLQVGLLAVGTQ